MLRGELSSVAPLTGECSRPRGVAGLVCLALIRLPTLWRAVIGLSILVAYQVVLDYALLDVVLQSVHGGLFGAISWAGLLILSSALADVWQRGAIWFALWSGALVVTALLSALIVPVSKNRVSLSYVLISLAISSLVFLGLKAVDRLRTSPPGLLCWWGENALALYLLHLVILGVFALPFGDWWYVDATWWLVTLQLMAILSVMSSAAMWLSRRRHAL